MTSSPGAFLRLIAAAAIVALPLGAAVGHGTPVSQVVPAASPPASPAPAPSATPVATGYPSVASIPALLVTGSAPALTGTASPALTGTAAPALTGTAAPALTGSAAPTPPSDYSIEIDLGKQRAYLLKSGHIVAESPVSSGREGHPTPTGNFEIIQKDLNHVSNLYGKFVDADTGRLVKAGADAAMLVPKGCKFVPAPMKWFMRFDGAAGMHAGILPGYAASHGCVRMPASKAELFYDTIAIGTPVHVFGTPPPHEIESETDHHATPTVVAQKSSSPPAQKKRGWWIF